MNSVSGLEDFRRQCERQLARSLDERIRFGFFRNPDPVRDRNLNRSFASLGEYRRFCEESYPAWFGYARPAPEAREAAAPLRTERAA